MKKCCRYYYHRDDVANCILFILVVINLVMNMTHSIHELSFGELYPAIVNPLDDSFELSRTCKGLLQDRLLSLDLTVCGLKKWVAGLDTYTHVRSHFDHIAFEAFQYFLVVVPTIYVGMFTKRLIAVQDRDLAVKGSPGTS